MPPVKYFALQTVEQATFDFSTLNGVLFGRIYVVTLLRRS